VKKLILQGCFVLLVTAFSSAYAGKGSCYEEPYQADDCKEEVRKGNLGALFNLGLMYGAGLNVPKDYVESAKWYRKAAEQGHADAQFRLGVMYFKGNGVPQDYKQTMKWYRKAAEQGNANAQLLVGAMYYKGNGVPQDNVMAHMFYNVAAASGSRVAASSRWRLANKMTASQIGKAQKLAGEWMASH